MMKLNTLGGKLRSARRPFVPMLVTFFCAVAVSAPFADTTALKVTSVPLAGVSGGANNVAFAFDRYALVAPFSPSTFAAFSPLPDGVTPDDLDNHFLSVIDTRKPGANVVTMDLKSSQGTIYYPTKVAFDQGTSILYLRGTRYDVNADGYEPIEVLAFVHLNLDDNARPVFRDNLVSFDIPGVASDPVNAGSSSDAPSDFAVAQNGKYLVFTNGASIFSYDVVQGALADSPLPIVPPEEYGLSTGLVQNSAITYLDLESVSGIISACWNRTTTAGDGSKKTTSELYFITLDGSGKLSLFKQVMSFAFPDGEYLTHGSNIAISLDPGTQAPLAAFFATSDGSLNQVNLQGSNVREVPVSLQVFPSLEFQGAADALSSPRRVRYDSVHRTIWAVNQGIAIQIRRPSGHRRHALPSPELARAQVEDSSIVLAQLSKRGKLAHQALFKQAFQGEGGLTNVLPDAQSNVLVSTYSGKLFAVASGDTADHSTISQPGDLGLRIDYLNYLTDRTSIVALSSFDVDQTSGAMLPGSVVVAKELAATSTQGLGTALEAFLPHKNVLKGIVLSIRRPASSRR